MNLMCLMPDQMAFKSGERIRLRLINAANARIFGLDFGAQPLARAGPESVDAT